MAESNETKPVDPMTEKAEFEEAMARATITGGPQNVKVGDVDVTIVDKKRAGRQAVPNKPIDSVI